MKTEIDQDFVLKAKERLLARAAALRDIPHYKKIMARCRAQMEFYQLDIKRRNYFG